MRVVLWGVWSIAMSLSVAGCTSTQVGPTRSIGLQDDVDYTRPLQKPDLSTFRALDPGAQAAMRNEVVTARMFAADVEFHQYEARLTRESQEEGLGATVSSLGLTTAATLVGGAATKSILSGAATALIGADNAYNERELLSNSIQALQSQMRTDRKAQAAIVYAKMFEEGSRQPSSIYAYTLPMALSDAEAYYQAGTIASALIGLSRTLATAERNADNAKGAAGPNPMAVSAAQLTTTPMADTVVSQMTTYAPHDRAGSPRALSGAAPSVPSPRIQGLSASGAEAVAARAKINLLVRQIENNNRVIAGIRPALSAATSDRARQDLTGELSRREADNLALLGKIGTIAKSGRN